MGAFVNAVALGVAGVLIVVEGVERIGAPTEVRGIGMLMIAAAIGLLVNLASAGSSPAMAATPSTCARRSSTCSATRSDPSPR
ncbi:MAG: hypothetical protein SangKO_082480 [Sandaracinaceae bacterium]